MKVGGFARHRTGKDRGEACRQSDYKDCMSTKLLTEQMLSDLYKPMVSSFNGACANGSARDLQQTISPTTVPLHAKGRAERRDVSERQETASKPDVTVILLSTPLSTPHERFFCSLVFGTAATALLSAWQYARSDC
jgi:hypothetical protein